MKFRILSNGEYYIIQKKGLFFWKYVKYVWSDANMSFTHFISFIENAKFNEIEYAQEVIENYRRYKNDYEFKQVKLIEETELYKKINIS